MESSERLAAATGFAVSDLAPVVIALVLIPLAAGLTVFADRVIDPVGTGPRVCAPFDGGFLADQVALAGPQPARRTTWSIRAPPSFV